uniref:Uncharacterized protein n=1 Tax=Anguilla anguilla TaxID=7936 RepID=A0A0E9PAP4_ANGAN
MLVFFLSVVCWNNSSANLPKISYGFLFLLYNLLFEIVHAGNSDFNIIIFILVLLLLL